MKLWSGADTLAINDWSGDGKYLLLTRWDTSKPALTGRGLWLLPNALEETGAHDPVLVQADALHGQFGPKIGPAHWIAFDTLDGSARQVFVRTMPDQPARTWQVSQANGNTSRWRADGRELYFVSSGSIVAADIAAGPSFRSGTLRPLFAAPVPLGLAASQYAHGWDVTPDGQRFLTTAAAPDGPARAITVVMNWQSALKP